MPITMLLRQFLLNMDIHSETLSDTVCKYPTYDKEMYSIVQAYRQWTHYILGKETIIHIDHRPL